MKVGWMDLQQVVRVLALHLRQTRVGSTLVKHTQPLMEQLNKRLLSLDQSTSRISSS